MEKNKASKTGRKHHDIDFKKRVLAHGKASGRSAAKIAQEFGVSTFTLYDWRKREEHQGPHGGLDAAGLLAENLRLKRELEEAREQRDILKKSLGILCEPQRKNMPASKRS